MSKVCGLILASGLSKRMGRDKLLLQWRGKPLIEHLLITAAKSPLDEIIVVTSAERLEPLKKMTNDRYLLILNSDPSLGMGSSLALGVRHLPPSADAVIVLLGDQPEVAAEDITQVVKINRLHMGDKMIIQTEYPDGRVGHPILFSNHYFTDLSQLQGDVGGRGMIQSNLKYVIRYQSPSTYPDDIDTVQDYERLLLQENRQTEAKEQILIEGSRSP